MFYGFPIATTVKFNFLQKARVVDVRQRMESYRHIPWIMEIPIRVFQFLLYLQRTSWEVIHTHRRGPFPNYFLFMFPLLQVLVQKPRTVVASYSSPLKLHHGKSPIPTIGCLIVSFVTATLIVSHDCTNIPLISLMSILFLHATVHIGNHICTAVLYTE